MLTPIPQPPGVPILGNIFDVDPNNTWASLKVLAEKYGKSFRLRIYITPQGTLYLPTPLTKLQTRFLEKPPV